MFSKCVTNNTYLFFSRKQVLVKKSDINFKFTKFGCRFLIKVFIHLNLLLFIDRFFAKTYKTKVAEKIFFATESKKGWSIYLWTKRVAKSTTNDLKNDQDSVMNSEEKLLFIIIFFWKNHCNTHLLR